VFPESDSSPRPHLAGTVAEVARRRPLVLRIAHEAPVGEVPAYLFDPTRQIATDLEGRPLGPMLKKDWTSYESTHTDGDGGDNETWGWEE
jgi:putative ATP-grasp target RiPP